MPQICPTPTLPAQPGAEPLLCPVPGVSNCLDDAPAIETQRVWGTDFARLDMSATLELAERIIERRRPEFFITANLNFLMLAEQYPRLHEVSRRSAAVLADGWPIVWRSRFTPQPLPARVAGADLIVELAAKAAEQGYRLFLLGAADGVAQAAADELQRRFPGLKIAGCYSPPYRSLSRAEHAAMLDSIRAAQPDILLVAFGQPKGEFWIDEHLQELQVPLSIQLGASFDFLAGTASRAPRAWQRVGCEWLYRALADPRRLVPRYARNLHFLIRQLARDLLGLI